MLNVVIKRQKRLATNGPASEPISSQPANSMANTSKTPVDSKVQSRPVEAILVSEAITTGRMSIRTNKMIRNINPPSRFMDYLQ